MGQACLLALVDRTVRLGAPEGDSKTHTHTHTHTFRKKFCFNKLIQNLAVEKLEKKLLPFQHMHIMLHRIALFLLRVMYEKRQTLLSGQGT